MSVVQRRVQKVSQEADAATKHFDPIFNVPGQTSLVVIDDFMTRLEMEQVLTGTRHLTVVSRLYELAMQSPRRFNPEALLGGYQTLDLDLSPFAGLRELSVVGVDFGKAQFVNFGIARSRLATLRVRNCAVALADILAAGMPPAQRVELLTFGAADALYDELVSPSEEVQSEAPEESEGSEAAQPSAAEPQREEFSHSSAFNAPVALPRGGPAAVGPDGLPPLGLRKYNANDPVSCDDPHGTAPSAPPGPAVSAEPRARAPPCGFHDELQLIVAEYAWPALTMLIFEKCGAAEVDASLRLLPELRTLSLRNNKLRRVDNLQLCEKLETVDLSQNRIEELDDIHQTLPFAAVRELNLSANRIRDPTPLCGIPALETLNLANNAIDKISHVRGLAVLGSVRTLRLSENPVTVHANFRAEVVGAFHRQVLAARAAAGDGAHDADAPACKFQLDGQYLQKQDVAVAAAKVEERTQLRKRELAREKRESRRSKKLFSVSTRASAGGAAVGRYLERVAEPERVTIVLRKKQDSGSLFDDGAMSLFSKVTHGTQMSFGAGTFFGSDLASMSSLSIPFAASELRRGGTEQAAEGAVRKLLDRTDDALRRRVLASSLGGAPSLLSSQSAFSWTPEENIDVDLKLDNPTLDIFASSEVFVARKARLFAEIGRFGANDRNAVPKPLTRARAASRQEPDGPWRGPSSDDAWKHDLFSKLERAGCQMCEAERFSSAQRPGGASGGASAPEDEAPAAPGPEPTRTPKRYFHPNGEAICVHPAPPPPVLLKAPDAFARGDSLSILFDRLSEVVDPFAVVPFAANYLSDLYALLGRRASCVSTTDEAARGAARPPLAPPSAVAPGAGEEEWKQTDVLGDVLTYPPLDLETFSELADVDQRIHARMAGAGAPGAAKASAKIYFGDSVLELMKDLLDNEDIRSQSVATASAAPETTGDTSLLPPVAKSPEVDPPESRRAEYDLSEHLSELSRCTSWGLERLLTEGSGAEMAAEETSADSGNEEVHNFFRDRAAEPPPSEHAELETSFRFPVSLIQTTLGAAPGPSSGVAQGGPHQRYLERILHVDLRRHRISELARIDPDSASGAAPSAPEGTPESSLGEYSVNSAESQTLPGEGSAAGHGLVETRSFDLLKLVTFLFPKFASVNPRLFQAVLLLFHEQPPDSFQEQLEAPLFVAPVREVAVPLSGGRLLEQRPPDAARFESPDAFAEHLESYNMFKLSAEAFFHTPLPHTYTAALYLFPPINFDRGDTFSDYVLPNLLRILVPYLVRTHPPPPPPREGRPPVHFWALCLRCSRSFRAALNSRGELHCPHCCQHGGEFALEAVAHFGERLRDKWGDRVRTADVDRLVQTLHSPFVNDCELREQRLADYAKARREQARRRREARAAAAASAVAGETEATSEGNEEQNAAAAVASEEEGEEEEDAEFFPMAREPAYMRGARRGGAGGSSSDDGHYVQAVQENSIEDVLFRTRCIIRRPSFLPVVTDPQACPHFARLQQDVAHDLLVPSDALMAAIFRAALPPPAIRYINKGRICALRERMKVREQLRQLEAEASAEPTSETDEFEAPPDAPPSAEEVQRRLHRQKLAERQRERLAVTMDAASDPSKYYRTSLDWERMLHVLKLSHLFVKRDVEDLAAMRLWMLPLNFYGGNPRLTTFYSAIVGLQSSFFLVGDRSIRMRKAPERHPLMRAPSYYLHRRNRHASDRFFVGHSFDIKWVRRIRVAPNSMRVRIEFHDALPLVVFTYDPDCCSELVTYVQYALELEYHRRDLSLTKACFDVVNDRDLYFERIRRDILAPRPLRPPAASGLSQKLLAEEAVVSYAIVRERRRLPSDLRHGLGAIPIYSLVVTSYRLFLLEEDFTLWPPSAQSAASTTRAPFRVHKEARAASVAELTLSQAHAEVFQIRFRGAAAPWLLFCNDWKHRAVVVRLLRAALPGAELGLDDGQIN